MDRIDAEANEILKQKLGEKWIERTHEGKVLMLMDSQASICFDQLI